MGCGPLPPKSYEVNLLGGTIYWVEPLVGILTQDFHFSVVFAAWRWKRKYKEEINLQPCSCFAERDRSSIFFLKVKGLSFSITKEGGCGGVGVGTGDGLVVSSKIALHYTALLCRLIQLLTKFGEDRMNFSGQADRLTDKVTPI
ncbi:hypothetical protein DPMN_084572 [Dreissena polymorpha]|uniref:Uncharacterized protein n=1 Tax=Dreissena polymorpha TaxID=45954 RepID=A0A9D4BJD6_DREPO|nr:hypothetical protein DPMN_084572 [Dreissena polymorpha]